MAEILKDHCNKPWAMQEVADILLRMLKKKIYFYDHQFGPDRYVLCADLSDKTYITLILPKEITKKSDANDHIDKLLNIVEPVFQIAKIQKKNIFNIENDELSEKIIRNAQVASKTISITTCNESHIYFFPFWELLHANKEKLTDAIVRVLSNPLYEATLLDAKVVK